MLAKAGLKLDDIDLFEINEAFAVVTEKFISYFYNSDRDKVNVNGGSIALLGDPIGATGSLWIGTILDELERRDLRRGLVTMCAAGGWRRRSSSNGFRSKGDALPAEMPVALVRSRDGECDHRQRWGRGS